MLRTIITVDNNNLTFTLPKTFLGKKVEVIAFVLPDTQEDKVSEGKKQFSALQLDTTNFEFNRDEANER